MKKGDRIAVMLPNLLAFPIAMLGIARAGAVQVNVNPLYTPRELEHQLNDAGVEVIVVFNGSTPTLAEIVGKTGVKTVITAAVGDGGATALPSPPVDARLDVHDGLRPGAGARQGPAAFTPVELTRRRPAVPAVHRRHHRPVQGRAALSHRNLVANVRAVQGAHADRRRRQEVIVTALPLYHIFALMVNFLTMFSVGAENWLVANPRDIDGLVDTMKKARPSVFMGVNTLYAGLTMHPRIGEVDWSRLHLAGGGGSAVIGATSAKWKQITGTFIREGYGLSETSPVLSFNPPPYQRIHRHHRPAPAVDRHQAARRPGPRSRRSAKPARSAPRVRR